MNVLISLWLPILLSAVVVFIISSLVHMVFKYHASDYGTVGNEEAVRGAINAGNMPPGRYVVPYCKDMKDMGTEEMKKKYIEGPVMHFTILPKGVPNMGKYLGQWFLWTLVIAAGVTWLTAKVYAGVPAQGAAKFAAVLTFMAHGCGTVTESIWVGRPWSSSAKYLLDAALYAAGTWGVFLWLWH